MEFRLLGPFEARADGRTVDVGRRQERLLLGILLLEDGQVVSTERLMDLIWDGNPPQSGRRTVHTYVARLRAALKDFGVAIRAQSGGYAVDGDHEVDVHRFTRLADDAMRTPRPQRRIELLDQVMGLWRGPLFADIAEEMLHGRLGATLETLWLSCAEIRAETNIELGRFDHVVFDVGALAGAYPTRERLVASLMVAYSGRGQLDEALALYRATYRTMTGEAGLEPSAALQRLHVRLLSGGATPHERAPAMDATPVSAIRKIPSWLPPDAPGFVGRSHELRRMDELMLRSDDAADVAFHTLLLTTVTGMPGVGKTALAVRWAHRVADRFPDGQLYVNLRGYDSQQPITATSALRLLLTALGVPQDRIPVDLDAAAGIWRTLLAGRRTLVVLDNARTVDQVRALLPGGHGNAVIVTSRDTLKGLLVVDHAASLTLDVLSQQDALDLLTRMLGPERVEREHLEALQLVRLCGSLPLALRIAAAHLAFSPATPIREFAAELTEAGRPHKLAVDDDAQAAVQSVFDHSYRALAPLEQRAFRLLSIAPGSDFCHHAAAAMLGAALDETRLALDRLADAHVMIRTPEGRYEFHDLMRSYAREQASLDEPADRRGAAMSRLLDFYLQLAAAANGVLSAHNATVEPTFTHEPWSLPFALETAAVIDFLDAEAGNLAEVVRYATESGEHRLGWQFTYLLSGYFDRGRDLDIALDVGRAGVEAAQRSGDPIAERRVRISLGAFCNNARRPYEALQHLRRAIELAHAAGVVRSEAAAINNVGRSHFQLHQYDEAAEAYRTALRLYQSDDQHAPGIGSVLNNLGHVHLRLRNFEIARAYLDEAVDFVREHLPAIAAFPLFNIGELLAEQGHHAEAFGYYDEALASARQAGHRYVECEIIIGIARAHRELKEYERAIETLETGIVRAARSGNADLRATMLVELATNHSARDEHSIAISYLYVAEEIRQLVPDADEQAAILRLRTRLTGN